MVMMAMDQQSHTDLTVPKSPSSVNERDQVDHQHELDLDHQSSKACSDPMSRHLQASPARGCREIDKFLRNLHGD